MRQLPGGTVTFLFTDIEGSTRLLHELGEDAYAEALAEHRRLLRRAFDEHEGVEVDTQGDAFFVAFPRATEALGAAAASAAALEGGPVSIRVGLHTGEPLLTAEGYVGTDVHRAARIAAAGHGGQILLSRTTRDLVDAELRDLGEHRLKDLTAPERIYQLGDGHFPPLRSLKATNLPVASSPLIGRDEELAEILDLLRDGARLLTVTGAGGTGKTRLALQVAAEVSDSFVDGTFFVPLAPLRSTELVAAEIGSALGIAGGGSPVEAVRDHVRERQLLLLLDNAEHLPELGRVLAEIGGAASRTKWLVTSRAPLHLSWEREYRLDPFPTAAATAFFVERARSARRDFVPDEAVPELCRRLDGLPLALELAAARVRLLSPAAILGRLESTLPLLAGGPRDAPERHRTLRATIDWSHDLLDDAERALFRRLSVFRGGCSLSAAETVCGADLDALASLVDKSLLKPVGDDRFLVLETLREYARERLEEAQETMTYARRHAEHFAARTEEVDRVLRVSRTAEYLAWLDAEADNLRAALDRLLELGEIDAAVRMGTLMASYWTARGRLFEGRRWLEGAVADPRLSPAVRAPALLRLADLVDRQGDYADAAAINEETLALAEQLGDDGTAAHALLGLAWTLYRRGDRSGAAAMASRAQTLAQRLGDDRTLGACYGDRGAILIQTGELEQARASLERALEIYRKLGDETNATIQLVNLAEIDFRKRDFGAGLRTNDEAVLRLRALGNEAPLPTALVSGGFAALAGGDEAGALARYRDALELTRLRGEKHALVIALVGIALAAVAHPQDAARLWGAATALRERLGYVPDELDQELERERVPLLEKALGAEAFARACANGAVLDLDAAADLALELAARPVD